MHQQNPKKLLILIAPPRSLSTAFLRMMANQAGWHIMNEPALSVFNQAHYPHAKAFYTPYAPSSYSKLIEEIQQRLEIGNVFIKEMSFSFEEFIAHYPALMRVPNAFFLFLLRNPHHCLISYYQKFSPATFDYLLNDLERLSGYKSLYHIAQCIQPLVTNPPYFIHAEALYKNPAPTIRKLCEHIDIPYQADYLQWPTPLDPEQELRHWGEYKKQEFAEHWHREALMSQGFTTPTSYAVDKNEEPTFIEISNKKHKEVCQKIYTQNKRWYDLLCQQGIDCISS